MWIVRRKGRVRLLVGRQAATTSNGNAVSWSQKSHWRKSQNFQSYRISTTAPTPHFHNPTNHSSQTPPKRKCPTLFSNQLVLLPGSIALAAAMQWTTIAGSHEQDCAGIVSASSAFMPSTSLSQRLQLTLTPQVPSTGAALPLVTSLPSPWELQRVRR